MLAIEVDGMTHSFEGAPEKDEIRQQRLETLGVRFIRFTEGEVKYDMQNVIRTLEWKIGKIVKNDNTVKLPKGFDMGWLD